MGVRRKSGTPVIFDKVRKFVKAFQEVIRFRLTR